MRGSLFHSPWRQQGFSLLELLIVCILISISLALAIPTVRNTLVTDQLATGSRKIISLIKSGRSKAIMTRQPYLILHDPAQQKLWYQEAGAEREETSTGDHPSITLPSGVHILSIKQAGGSKDQDPGKSGLWISKQGYMDKTAIHLGDGSNKSISLLISPFLHTIQVIDGPVHFD